MSGRYAAVLLLTAVVFVPGAAPAGAFVDLTQRGALEELQASNPEHFARIGDIIEGLREEPARAETDWLEVTFHASDVDLSRLLIRTSHPPKQSLTFTLDGTRYRLFVARSDLTGQVVPAQ